jgi:hypothetical protein
VSFDPLELARDFPDAFSADRLEHFWMLMSFPPR